MRDATVDCLRENTHYRFLRIPERMLQDEKLALDAAKVYLRRISVIWSSPLSVKNQVYASNQFALPVLSYLI